MATTWPAGNGRRSAPCSANGAGVSGGRHWGARLACDEVVHSIIDLMYSGGKVRTMTHAMHIHPTVSELLPTLFGDLKPLA